MLPYATPAIAAQLDPYEERERDTLRTTARQQLGPPARAGARIALAICEIEAGLRSPLQLEQGCHLTLWPKLSQRLRRSGGPAAYSGGLRMDNGLVRWAGEARAASDDGVWHADGESGDRSDS